MSPQSILESTTGSNRGEGNGRQTSARMHRYAAETLASLRARVPWEQDFLHAVEELFFSISPVLEQNPRYEGERILERIIEPERVVAFRVPMLDDRNRVVVYRGYRVQFNSALGPYKGGLRFHASVDLGSLKFLAFEQTFKNALTGLPMGGGKGGADFQLAGKSDAEVMRFCQSFMTELHEHIGPETDVPAGDIGVGGREIGYLFGQYKRLTRRFNAAMTGKGVRWGGSRLRPEATGFGLAYFVEEMLKTRGEALEGKTVAVSGFGNVAWGTVKKVTELGAKVVTLSGPDGFVHDPDGVSGEKIDFMLTMRSSGVDQVQQYAREFGVSFVPDARPWTVPCDVALPCAIQNELDRADAEALIRNGCKAVVEGANMPVTSAAANEIIAAGLLYAPGKASNAGGVAVSGFEMSQNRSGQTWTPQTVDDALRRTMGTIHEICVASAAEYGAPGNYMVGANIGGFTRVADAMMDQGVV